MSSSLQRQTIRVAVFLLLAAGAAAYAQENPDREGRIEAGVRQVYGNTSSAKFNEYRDIPDGFVIPHVEVSLDNLFQNSFFFHFQARDVREKDETFLVDLGAYRKYRLDLKWDQIPHVFTNTARSFLTETSPGLFVATDAAKAAFAAAGTNIPALQNTVSGFPLVPMSLRRDKGNGELALTPGTDWTVKFDYSHEKMFGHRPFGTTTNSFTNVIELPEPIDYRTNLVSTGAEYATKTYALQASYYGSFFHNNVDTLTWDVPFPVTGTSSARGRLDLYPSNNAQNFNVAGAVNMAHKTRFMASVTPGWMHQNDAFMPLTINPLLSPAPLPAASLNGQKQTLAMNYTLNTKVIPRLPVTFRYTSYDYNNNTKPITFQQVVITDASLSGPFTTEPFGYNKKDVNVEAAYEVFKNSDLKFLYNWERFDREEREVAQSTENTLGASLDITPYHWLMLRGSYRHGDRDPEEYIGSDAMLPSLRKYDEAARIRHQAQGLLQITPIEPVSFTAAYTTVQDDYQKRGCIWLGYDQCYGLLSDVNFNYSFGVNYDPSAKLDLYVEYTKEKYKYAQLSRQRNPASGTTPANDTPNNDWQTDRRDKVDNYAAGITATLHPKAILDIYYTLSVADNKIFTRALGNPAITGFLVTTAPPLAPDYPDSSNRWHQLDTTLKFPLLSGNLTPKIEYRYEKYDRVDFQLVNAGQYFNDPQLTTSLFLGVGADVPGYDAHIVTASLEYRF